MCIYIYSSLGYFSELDEVKHVQTLCLMLIQVKRCKRVCYMYLLLSTGITLAPFTRSSIEYTCNDDENQKAMVNFPVSY